MFKIKSITSPKRATVVVPIPWKDLVAHRDNIKIKVTTMAISRNAHWPSSLILNLISSLTFSMDPIVGLEKYFKKMGKPVKPIKPGMIPPSAHVDQPNSIP